MDSLRDIHATSLLHFFFRIQYGLNICTMCYFRLEWAQLYHSPCHLLMYFPLTSFNRRIFSLDILQIFMLLLKPRVRLFILLYYFLLSPYDDSLIRGILGYSERD